MTTKETDSPLIPLEPILDDHVPTEPPQGDQNGNLLSSGDLVTKKKKNNSGTKKSSTTPEIRTFDGKSDSVIRKRFQIPSQDMSGHFNAQRKHMEVSCPEFTEKVEVQKRENFTKVRRDVEPIPEFTEKVEVQKRENSTKDYRMVRRDVEPIPELTEKSVQTPEIKIALVPERLDKPRTLSLATPSVQYNNDEESGPPQLPPWKHPPRRHTGVFSPMNPGLSLKTKTSEEDDDGRLILKSRSNMELRGGGGPSQPLVPPTRSLKGKSHKGSDRVVLPDEMKDEKFMSRGIPEKTQSEPVSFTDMMGDPFVRNLTPPSSDSMDKVEPAIIEGRMKVDGRLRFAKLTLYKIELWRQTITSVPAARISLGMKRMEFVSNRFIKIKDDLRGKTVILDPADDRPEQWAQEIERVIKLYIQVSLENKVYSLKTWVVQQLRVWVGTWNVGNTIPENDLSAWLPSDSYDIIAVGSQECKYPPKSTHSHGEDWFGRVSVTVGPKYIAIARESLWEIRNIVFVRRDISGFIHSVETNTVATGIANTLGNKGGVGIRFYLYDTSFLMINAHLAAHAEQCASRNFDYSEIINNMKLGRYDVDVMNEHNYSFFYGDLNYRLEGDRATVLQLVEEGNMEKLHELDQLKRELANKRAFTGWTERLPTFRPTYRYERNSVENSKRVYSAEKMRVMSWCDRIMYRSHPWFKIIHDDYDCCDSILSSDHSPVYGTFRLYARLQCTAPQIFSESFRSPKIEKKSYLKFSEVEVSVSDFEKIPNIYIKFVAPFLPQDKKSKTPIEKKTANAHWSTIRKFPVSLPYKEYILTQHVLCVVMDDTVGNNIPLGQAVLGLEKACGDSPAPFKIIIYARGFEVGEISGDVHVTDLISLNEELQSLNLPEDKLE